MSDQETIGRRIFLNKLVRAATGAVVASNLNPTSAEVQQTPKPEAPEQLLPELAPFVQSVKEYIDVDADPRLSYWFNDPARLNQLRIKGYLDVKRAIDRLDNPSFPNPHETSFYFLTLPTNSDGELAPNDSKFNYDKETFDLRLITGIERKNRVNSSVDLTLYVNQDDQIGFPHQAKKRDEQEIRDLASKYLKKFPKDTALRPEANALPRNIDLLTIFGPVTVYRAELDLETDHGSTFNFSTEGRLESSYRTPPTPLVENTIPGVE